MTTQSLELVDGRYLFAPSDEDGCASAPPAPVCHFETMQSRRVATLRPLRRKTPLTRQLVCLDADEPIRASNQTLCVEASTIRGDNNCIIGDNNVIFGSFNEIRGRQCRVRGDHNKLYGREGTSIGCNNIVIGGRSTSVSIRAGSTLSSSQTLPVVRK